MSSVVQSRTGRAASAPPVSDALHVALLTLRGDAPRVVVWGPPGSGRTTLVRNLATVAMASGPVTCTSVELEGARLAWSDVRTSAGFVARYVAAEDEATETGRRAILAGASVVLFVADSRPSRLEANRRASQELYALWSELHSGWPAPTVVLAANKRDAEFTLDTEVIVDELEMLAPVDVLETVSASPKALASLLKATTRAVVTAAAGQSRVAG